jgi:hypothetical protein
MEGGLLCYPAQGCADGENGDHILLAPAYTTTSDELEEIVQRLGRAIEACLPITARRAAGGGVCQPAKPSSREIRRAASRSFGR